MADCIVEVREWIAPADILRRFGMDGLQAKFDPDRFDGVELLQEFNDFFARQSGLVPMESATISGCQRIPV